MKKLAIILTVPLLLSDCVNQKSTKEVKSGSYPDALSDIYEEASKTTNLRSFLISKDNQLIAEQYFDSYSSDSLDHLRSVTKSVIATLVGIAIDQGFIPNVDVSIDNYLEVPDDKKKITLRHLLTMTSGIQWNEGGNAEGYSAWSTSSNELKYVLDKPMAATPGEVWNYNSGATHIISAILTESTGMNTLKFATKYLFEPLGIWKVRWEMQKDGYYNGAAGLELRPIDMIKIGELYAKDGLFDGRQILSGDYIKTATSYLQPENMSLEEGSGYGYCWWLGEEEGIGAYAALGYGGQIILVTREENIVVVITHNWRRMNGTTANSQTQNGINKLAFNAVKELIEK